jgi:hypothetical protein
LANERPFQLLSSDEVQLLVSSFKYRTAYIDCLALLQGVLVQFGSRPSFPTSDNLALVDDSIREALSKLPPEIASKMRVNTATAFHLRAESIASEVASRLGLVKLVDNFLEALVIQYQILRAAGSEPMPRVMEAASQSG